MRRLTSALATLAIVAGLLMVGDAIATVLWQEPLSAFKASRAQGALADRLDRELRSTAPSATELKQLRQMPRSRQRIAFAAGRLRARTPEGAPLGRIVLPSQDKRFVLVAGDSESDLRKGPGVYPSTPLPGEGGTTAVAGHRTTYLAPFRDVDRLRAGDVIEMQMPYGTFTYAVERSPRIVQPDEVGVIRKVAHERLVLTACHPLHSAAQRIVVFARLVHTTPDRQALGLHGGLR